MFTEDEDRESAREQRRAAGVDGSLRQGGHVMDAALAALGSSRAPDKIVKLSPKRKVMSHF